MHHFIELTECHRGIVRTITYDHSFHFGVIYGYKYEEPLALSWKKITALRSYNDVDIYDTVFPRTIVYVRDKKYAVLESFAQIEAKIAAAKKEK